MPERTCRFCGCTDDNACVDPFTGEPCSWAEYDLCTSCVGEYNTGHSEPLVKTYTEGDLNALLRGAR